MKMTHVKYFIAFVFGMTSVWVWVSAIGLSATYIIPSYSQMPPNIAKFLLNFGVFRALTSIVVAVFWVGMFGWVLNGYWFYTWIFFLAGLMAVLIGFSIAEGNIEPIEIMFYGTAFWAFIIFSLIILRVISLIKVKQCKNT